MRIRNGLAAAVSSLLVLSAAACGGTPNDVEPDTTAAGNCNGESITVTYGQPSIQNAPIWIATDLNLFEKYGLRAELTQITGAAITQALISGQTDFIRSTTASTFNAKLEGGDVLLVGSIMNKNPYDIVAKADNVPSPAAMRGKTAAVTSGADGTTTAVRIALADAGIAFEDINIIIGFSTDAERLAAVQNGLADFAPVTASLRPEYTELGLHAVTSLLDADTHYIQGGLFTRSELAEEQPQVVTCFLKAVADALHVFHNDKATSLRIIANYLRQSEAEVEPSWELFGPAINETVDFTFDDVRSSMLAQVGDAPELATADPADFADTSFVDALRAEGFYETLG